MRFFTIIALLAVSALAVSSIEEPPKLHGVLTPYERSRRLARQQLEAAVSGVGLTADVSASISTGFFNRVLSEVDTLINQVGTSIVIPGVSEKHYGFSDIHFTQFTIGAITVSTSAPNSIVVNIADVGITIPETDFHVKADKLIHCAGKVQVTIEGAYFTIALAMGNDGNGHITTQATVTTAYQELKVEHKFDHWLCKIANSIINDLVGNIDKIIDKAIKQDLPKLLSPALTKSFDAMFAKIPLHFTGTPAIVNAGISVSVDLLASAATIQTITPTSLPQLSPYQRVAKAIKDFGHDITLDVPAASMNNIMTAAHSAGLLKYDIKLDKTTSVLKDLIPAAYTACPDCKLDLVFNLLQAPTVTFATDDIDATANNVDVAFNAINNATGAVVPLFVVNINSTLDVNNVTVRSISNLANLYFQLQMKQLSITLQSSSIGTLPVIDIIGNLLAWVIQSLAVPAFNLEFQGFTFPALFSNVVVTALNGIFEFESDLLMQPIN